MFLHIGVNIVTRRFVSTGIANELHRVHLNNRAKTKVSADSVGLPTHPSNRVALWTTVSFLITTSIPSETLQFAFD